MTPTTSHLLSPLLAAPRINGDAAGEPATGSNSESSTPTLQAWCRPFAPPAGERIRRFVYIDSRLRTRKTQVAATR